MSETFDGEISLRMYRNRIRMTIEAFLIELHIHIENIRNIT